MTSDLFASTAWYYARYRSDYPPEAYAALERKFTLDRRGTLLDLGTGTGQIALHLAHRFERTVALDVSAEMIAAAREAAAERGVEGIEWHVMPAEELGALGGGPYRVVTMGSSFHWMEQARVLELCYERTEAGGGIFICGLPGFVNIDNVPHDDPVGAIVQRVVRRHLGERRRAGSGYYSPPPKRWEEYLEESRYVEIEQGAQAFEVVNDIESLLGVLYSTSFANKSVLGERVGAFEADLREELRALDPSGRYRQTLLADWVMATKR